jgi:hypothetical protein
VTHTALAAAAAVAAAGAVFLGLDNLFYTAQVLGLPTDKRISVNSLEAAAKKQCSLSWHAVQAQLAKQAGSSKPQDDPYLLKVGACGTACTDCNEASQQCFTDRRCSSPSS